MKPRSKECNTISSDPLPRFLIHNRMALVVGAHVVLFALALLSAFCLANNFKNYDQWFVGLYLSLFLLACPLKLLVFHWTRQYHGSWRYVGLRDLFGVISSSLMATFVLLIAYFLLENAWYRIFGYVLIDRQRSLHQSSVFALDWAATIVFVSAGRILARFYYEDIQPQRASNPRRVLIVGAGDTGEAVLREILRMRRERYTCIGILDDDVAQLRGRIHDVEVLGRTSEIRAICQKYDVAEVLLTSRYATPKIIRRLVGRCEGTAVHFRTMPAVSDVIEGRVKVSRIRDVDIADLLGREPIELDTQQIGRQLRGRRALVTGAGGSIGAAMCRQIADFRPERLILLERAENALFEIERELRKTHPDLVIVPCVADVTDRKRLESIFQREKPSIVFHAAAHKHVPMMEANPGEAIKNNIGGTAAVADTVLAAGVEKMVVISTDKAVNPTSSMGCTKRAAEMYVESLSGKGRSQFVTVRFGNVLGSSGSVVPIFKQQIAAGGPVTVTHVDMVRYFMTIAEAAQLVLQAGAMGKGGEIFVLHMGDPVRIVDLARDMISLSGLRPGVDIEITFSGKRPGEKLFEELSFEGEHIGDTEHPKIGIWKHRLQDREAVHRGIARLMEMADMSTNGQLQAELKRLVPEYAPDTTSNSSPQPSTSLPAPASNP